MSDYGTVSKVSWYGSFHAVTYTLTTALSAPQKLQRAIISDRMANRVAGSTGKAHCSHDVQSIWNDPSIETGIPNAGGHEVWLYRTAYARGILICMHACISSAARTAPDEVISDDSPQLQ